MSAVTVIDSSARQHKVKVTPSTPLVDILTNITTKLNLDSSQYSLRHNKKLLDLSLPFRLSGLSNSARLELVLLSRSPSVVTIALQLPPEEVRDSEETRLLERFPSDTTLWTVIRRFESQTESRRARNFTARGTPRTNSSSNAGTGRLYYQTPVLTLMSTGGGREVSSFEEFQRTLSQCGLRDGSFSFKLSFRETDKPLEVMMEEVDKFFNSKKVLGTVQESAAEQHDARGSRPELMDVDSQGANNGNAAPSAPSAAQQRLGTTPSQRDENVGNETGTAAVDPAAAAAEQEDSSGDGKRPISVILPASTRRPLTAIAAHNDSDYDLSVDQARQHIALLERAGKPRRLLSDAEIEAKEKESRARLASIKEVEVKIRFPDQTAVVTKFTAADTALDLYSWVEDLLANPTLEWNLKEQNPKSTSVIERDQKQLIKHLKLSGKVLVNFMWGESVTAVQRRAPALKSSVQSQGKELSLKEPDSFRGEDRMDVDNGSGSGSSNANKGKESKKVDVEAKMKKWLGFGKK